MMLPSSAYGFIASMTILSAIVSGGGSAAGVRHGTASSTISDHRAASATVMARARGPNSAISPESVSGPRELLSATSCPAFTNNRAAVAPIMPAPTMPILMNL
jgi:hypothetical protein